MSDPLNEQLGDRIREDRCALGLTQGDLASVLEISRTALTNIEAGKQNLSYRQLIKIMYALDWPCLERPSVETRTISVTVPVFPINTRPETGHE